jgi:ribosomal protein S18 acetylase RimI-like enzyme
LIQLRAHVVSSFADLPGAVHELLSQAPSFDLTLPWLDALARHTTAQDERLELLWLEGTEPDTAGAFLATVRQGSGGSMAVRGRSLRALANYYSACFAPLIAPSCDPARAADTFADALVSEVGDWETVDLNPMAPESPFFAALERGLHARGCFVQRYFRFGNWYLEVGGRDYATYLSGLSSRTRNTLKRKGRKLDELGETQFEILQTVDGLDAALTAFEEIYARSWRTQAEPYPAFIREVAREFARRGWLRLGVLRVGEQTAAAQIWFVYDRTASIFKLAYDPQYQEHSVGSLLTAHLMRHVIDVDRVEVVDYLSGDDPYKQEWMSARRERWGLRAYRLTSVAGLAGAARSLAGTLARRGLSAVRAAGSRIAS